MWISSSGYGSNWVYWQKLLLLIQSFYGSLDFIQDYPSEPVPERYGKTKTNLDFLEQETVSGSGIICAICKSAPQPRQITTPAPTTQFFIGWMPFLPPNQQRQGTEGWVFTKTVGINQCCEWGANALPLMTLNDVWFVCLFVVLTVSSITHQACCDCFGNGSSCNMHEWIWFLRLVWMQNTLLLASECRRKGTSATFFRSPGMKIEWGQVPVGVNVCVPFSAVRCTTWRTSNVFKNFCHYL